MVRISICSGANTILVDSVGRALYFRPSLRLSICEPWYIPPVNNGHMNTIGISRVREVIEGELLGLEQMVGDALGKRYR